MFIYGALLLWTLFSEWLTRSTTSTVSNAGIMTKVYFPRLVMLIFGILPGISASVICYTSWSELLLRG